MDSILHLLVSLPQKRRHVGFEEAVRMKRPRDESTKRTRCLVLPFLPLSLSLRLWSLVFYSNEGRKRRNCTRGKRVRRASSFDEIPRKKTKKGERVKRKERKKEARNGKRPEEEDPPERSSSVRFLLVDQIFQCFDRFESSLNTKAFLAWKNRTKSTKKLGRKRVEGIGDIVDVLRIEESKEGASTRYTLLTIHGHVVRSLSSTNFFSV